MGTSRRIANRGALVPVLTATLAVALAGCGQQGTPTVSAPPTASSKPAAAASAAAPAATQAVTSSAASAAAAGARCATRWGTGAKSTGTRMSAAELYKVRAGRHPCYDRLVFDVNGTAAVDASVRYVPVVLSDGAGRPVKVSGRAALEVVVRAWYLGAGSSGHQPYRQVPRVGDRLVPASTLGGLAASGCRSACSCSSTMASGTSSSTSPGVDAAGTGGASGSAGSPGPG
jgi:predicted small lipoprotein YifL